MRWLLAALLFAAAPAFAQDEPTGFIDCDIPAGRFQKLTPADLNVRLFESGETLSGTWRLEEVYPHPVYGSFMALVLDSDATNGDGEISEIILRRCANPTANCVSVRAIKDGKPTALPGSARMPMEGVGSFRLRRESERRWIIEINDRRHVVDLPHDVSSFQLKCVGAKGWFDFTSEPLS